MLFSSVPFLFYFLPCVLLVYFLVPGTLKNGVLLLASLLFYGWGEPRYLLVMLAAIAQGYVFGLLIEKSRGKRRAGLYLALSVLLSLGTLVYFKYADFMIRNLNALTGLSVPLLSLALPVGISFYTFQILSYTVDVYRGTVPAQRNLIDLAAYIAMFPQLIAGPIVRYSDIAPELRSRTHMLSDAAAGTRRFVLGLAKKILFANLLGELVSGFRASQEQTVLYAWLGAAAFTLQIYYDFSGYSDMAIGLGLILGFHFPENFRYPYCAGSITEFWRRWHISLGSWFRDYLYIPLGGNRKGKARKYLNNMITFLASGLWHGASWHFVVWGGLNGAYQVVGEILRPTRERLCAALHIRRESLVWQALRVAITFVFIDFAWLFFRASSLTTAVDMIRCALAGGAAMGEGFTLGLEVPELRVMAASILLLAVVDVVNLRCSIRTLVTRLPLPVRWVIYLVSIYVILIFGIYGPGFSESQFIYFQF